MCMECGSNSNSSSNECVRILTIKRDVYAEFTDMPCTSMLPTCDGISENLGVTLQSFSHMYDCTTVIRLVVRVPVLSEQMAVALPIVSQASKCRTKLLSFIIFWASGSKRTDDQA